MKNKYFISGFIILLISLSFISEVKAQTNSSNLKILSPVSVQTYRPGDTVEIKWSSDLPVSSRHAVTVNLVSQNSKRYRIGYITRNQVGGNYSVKWKIPGNFFQIKKIKTDSADFRIEIRPEGNFQKRLSSGIYLINISKTGTPGPAQIENTPNVNNTPQTPVQLSARSQYVARYVFKSTLEPWMVKKLTVVNDTQNDGFDPDPNEFTDAVDKIYIKYPDSSGTLKISSADYTNGKATFSGLDFYIPNRGTANVDLYVDPVDPNVSGGQFSGKKFRVGIQSIANNPSTFEAVGLTSDTTVNDPGVLYVSSSSTQESIVRDSVLNFAVPNPSGSILLNGENDLYSFTVSSKSASLGRLVFNIDQSGLTSLDNVKVYRNNQFLTPGDSTQTGNIYLMWDSGPASCFAQSAQSGAGTGMDCNGSTKASAKLILTFSKEEFISGTNTYKLSFNVGGAISGSSVTIRLNHDDDFAEPVILGSNTLNGKIYNGGLNPELFTNATDFTSEATTITNRNIIWSDRSADSHNYPALSPALLPTTDTGSSADWTNGYLLGLNGLQAVTSKR